MLKRLLRVDTVITVAFGALAVYVLSQARGWPVRAALFPTMIGWALLGLSLLKLAADVIAARRPAPATAPSVEPSQHGVIEARDVFATAPRAQWLSALGWMAMFFVLLWLLGALLAVPLFAVVYLLVASGESPTLAGVYACAAWLFVYGLFDRLLHLPLPAGVLLARWSG